MEKIDIVQAMLVDIYVKKCGHFAVQIQINKKMSYYGFIYYYVSIET